MAKQRLHSFEAIIEHFGLVTIALLVALLSIIAYLIDASLLEIATALLLIVVPYCYYLWRVKHAIKTPLMGLSVSLEAIRHEDYSLRSHPNFNAGAIKALSDEVNLMAEDLRIRKLHYDQQAVLVLNLIEQLATPIAVFDQDGRLNHANDAFSVWCGRPWRQSKLLSARALGLTFDNRGESGQLWQIEDQDRAAQWQLRHSSIAMLGEAYQLVVLTNIEKVVNETERLAWHKMTRVLSHEINNSLSPIKSLAQSLVDVFAQQSDDKSAIEALEVIASRSDSLMTFVNRYASLNQQYDVNLRPLKLSSLMNKVVTLFEQQIMVEHCDIEVTADAVLLEQVLINLIKNAIEASRKDLPVTVSARTTQNGSEIWIEDNGAGIANPDNLFVPFYTTKDQGKGIGLALSRNMIEQLGGRLTLQNKKQGQGAKAVISLPNLETVSQR